MDTTKNKWRVILMKIKSNYLILDTDKPITETTSKLRGYIGNKYKEHALLHNHYKDNYLYSYPLIQYKIINKKAIILGIDEGTKTLEDIIDTITELKLDNTYKITDRQLYKKEYNVRVTPEEYHYKIITPWLSLNSKNYQIYMQLNNWKDKKILLNKILIGNILSMCKGLGIIANYRIHARTHLDEEKIKYKSVYLTGFKGEFITNFKLPPLYGLGKGTSHGYGTIIPVDEYEFPINLSNIWYIRNKSEKPYNKNTTTLWSNKNPEISIHINNRHKKQEKHDKRTRKRKNIRQR